MLIWSLHVVNLVNICKGDLMICNGACLLFHLDDFFVFFDKIPLQKLLNWILFLSLNLSILSVQCN